MSLKWLLKPRWLVFMPLVLVLIIAVACGEDATPTPLPTRTPTAVPPTATPVPGAPAPTATPRPAATATPVSAAPAATATPRPVSPEPTPTPVPTAIPTATPLPVVTGLVPKYGGIIPMTGFANPTGWDPHLGALVEDASAMSNMYNQLVEYDPINPTEVIGDLAETWALNADGKSYDFTIYDGVTWTDGQPLTIHDVIFSLKRIVDPDARRPTIGALRNYLKPEGVEQVGDRTVRVNLEFPTGAFIRFFALDPMKILPKHHLTTGVDFGIFENRLGSGPFKGVSFDHGVAFEFEKNPNYFKPGRPFFDGIKAFLILDGGTEIACYRTERCLMGMGTIHHIGIDDFIRLGEDADFMSKFDIHWQLGASGSFVLLNTERAPFDDERVRRALFLVLDRQELTEGFGFGKYTIGSPMSVNNPLALPQEELLALPGYRQLNGKKHPDDIAEAKRLLEEAGLTGFKAQLVGPTVSNLPEIAQLVAQQFRTLLGLDIEIVPLDIATATKAAQDRDYEMMIKGIASMVNDPDDRFGYGYLLNDRNYSSWHDPEVDALFAQQQLESDPVKRKEIVLEMQRKVLNGAPGVLENFWKSFGSIVSRRVKTEVGHYVQRASLFTSTKHEHEWLEPKE